MKNLQFLLIALLATLSFTIVTPGPAKADHLRWMIPGYFPPPPQRRVYRYYPDVYEDDYYGDDFDDYDEGYSYYEEPEPFYKPPPRRKKKSTASAPSKVKPKTVEKPKKKPAQTASVPESAPKPKKTTASAPAKTTASTGVSCDKAKSIVTGYGFSNIQTQSCTGSVYSFAASRGGKSFSVKVSALNGELTEVKRQ